MKHDIAIIGMACRYPDASSPHELWKNALARRQAFRQLPKTRLRREDYFHPDPQALDTTYSCYGAVLKDYKFDRTGFKVTGVSYRSADVTHWLALDVAAQALKDASFEQGKDLPKDNTRVILGNTLTGEFSRANVMRLRWPYVKRVLENILCEQNVDAAQRIKLVEQMERDYKSAFPPINEETLAGGLANTIAGRICNYFDLHGGGFTVDGACSSSLLAVAQASSALLAEDIDVAIVGGVDLSLDPFEIIGFAKAGALAKKRMFVYDRRSNGFWPGEGCGILVLMREEDARRQSRRIHAVIKGWGISSDGSGGITRPEKEGQIMALKRAYKRAGFEPGSVSYFEGHGTGTALGDSTELSVLSEASHSSKHHPERPLPVVGSVKANIGHTKAAAGVAGLIKAVMAVKQSILPPNTGCNEPHHLLDSEGATIRTLPQPEAWPEGVPIRVGVSAMGFGGVNSHIVVEKETGGLATHSNLSPEILNISRSAQDAEIFIFTAETAQELLEQAGSLVEYAGELSFAELADLANALYQKQRPNHLHAALVAATPEALESRLSLLIDHLKLNSTLPVINIEHGVFIGTTGQPATIGFLFPGQAAPVYNSGGAIEQRFQREVGVCRKFPLPDIADVNDTRLAQPSIMRNTLIAADLLKQFNVQGAIGVGHSVGEIAALAWAGVLTHEDAFALSINRGEMIHEYAIGPGGMLGVRLPVETVELLLKEFNDDTRRLSIAAINNPDQTIVAGNCAHLDQLAEKLQQQDIDASHLPVSHAFHSTLLEPVRQPFRDYLDKISFEVPDNKLIYSTITGNVLDETSNFNDLLAQQLVAPVQFHPAFVRANEKTDLWVELGPGHILSNITHRLSGQPAIALDVGGNSLRGLLLTLAASHALGVEVDFSLLFEQRYVKPFDLNWKANFLSNPCESAPIVGGGDLDARYPVNLNGADAAERDEAPGPAALPKDSPQTPLKLVKTLISKKAELPIEIIHDDNHLLGDLHLNSIAVGQIVVDVCRQLNILPPEDPTRYANATVIMLAESIEAIAQSADPPQLSESQTDRFPLGVEAWVRPFVIEPVETPLGSKRGFAQSGVWQVWARETTDFVQRLKRAFADFHVGNGTLICMPGFPDEAFMAFVLPKLKNLIAAEKKHQAIFVHTDATLTGSALAKTLKLEMPAWDILAIQVPAAHPDAIAWVKEEIQRHNGFAQVTYNSTGQRFEYHAQLADLTPSAENHYPLTSKDVLLVSGGGKGIGAECALHIARRCGVRLLLLGRSDPESDADLKYNLNRLKAHGVEYMYLTVDVSNSESLRLAVQQGQQLYGPITACLHSAGYNHPRLITQLTLEDYRKTLAPKVYGLQNILSALDLSKLKLLVNFGSIIGRAGLMGQADYALANEWSTAITEAIACNHPHCRCLALEWSVWAGAGMGERLGTLEKLEREGIQAISLEAGLSILDVLLHNQSDSLTAVIASRFGRPPTLAVTPLAEPLLRFVESVKVYYPGIELVVDVKLSVDKDPYIQDHIYQGEQLLPGVVGLEAMAQVAMTLAGAVALPAFESVQFKRPIVIPERDELVIRIAALKLEGGQIKVVIRNSQTGFQGEDFEALCKFDNEHSFYQPGVNVEWECPQRPEHTRDINPRESLYGPIFFHTGRFVRLTAVRYLNAKECWVDISTHDKDDWFSPYLPGEWKLGDPGARDAVIHSVQACIPHERLLPVGVEHLWISNEHPDCHRYMHARERQRVGDDFIYDIEVYNENDELIEHWQGLKLKRIAPIATPKTWPLPLALPFITRRCQELTGWDDLQLGLNASSVNRNERTGQLQSELLSEHEQVVKRSDGKPEIIGSSKAISIAHSHELSLMVLKNGVVGCDIEAIEAKHENLWRELLGLNRFAVAQLISRKTSEPIDSAATRIWTVIESVKKLGMSLNNPINLESVDPDGALLLRVGSARTVSLKLHFKSATRPCCLAITASGKDMNRPKNINNMQVERNMRSLENAYI